jgi:hypothetical protein
MDPNAMRFGSGSPLLGGTQSIQSGVPALSQVGGASPISQPMPQPPTSGVMGQTPDMAMQGAVPQPGMPQGSDEASIILSALSNRLKSNSKIQEAQAIPPKPTMPGMI